MSDIKIQLASHKLKPLYANDPSVRFYVLRGGRGSGKSYSVGQYLLLKAYTQECRILCVREFQTSIKKSIYAQICLIIEDMGLGDYFRITNEYIECIHTKSIFYFVGLQDMSSIKSIAGVTDVWAEEAATITESMWDRLIPTIRTPNSKFYICYNPQHLDDYTHTYFGLSTSPDTCVIEMNYNDNLYWPQELEAERLKMLATDPVKHDHVYGGGTQVISDAVIFAGRYRVEEFDLAYDRNRRFYYGMDFGFNDPTCGLRAIYEHDRVYVDYEAYATKLTIDQTPQLLRSHLPDIDRWPLYCDESRPDSIAFLAKNGLRASGAPKGKGSILDGVEWLRARQIVVHPRCENLIRELGRYSYKIDKNTEEVLPIIAPGHDHLIDSLRYALYPLIKSTGGLESFLRLAHH